MQLKEKKKKGKAKSVQVLDVRSRPEPEETVQERVPFLLNLFVGDRGGRLQFDLVNVFIYSGTQEYHQCVTSTFFRVPKKDEVKAFEKKRASACEVTSGYGHGHRRETLDEVLHVRAKFCLRIGAVVLGSFRTREAGFELAALVYKSFLPEHPDC